MKCPKCGHENRDDAVFCNACGARLTDPGPDKTPESPYAPPPTWTYTPPAQPSRFRLALRAFLAVLLFIGIMLACQSCVITGYLTSLMMQNGMAAAAAQNGMSLSADSMQEMMRDLIEAVYDNMAVIMLIANLLTLFVICLIFRLRRRSPAVEFAFHFVNPLRLAEFALLGSAVNVVVSVALTYLPLPEAALDAFNELYSGFDGSHLALEILAVVLVGPLVEEIIFRGIAMTRFCPTFGDAAAVFLSALLFGLVHGTPIAVGYSFLVGILLALIYLRYRSIVPGVVFHCFFNFTPYWLTHLGDTALIIVFAVSVALTVVLVFSALVRYPRFDDVVCDTAGRIRVKDAEKQAVIDDVRRLRTKSEASAEEVEELRQRWNEAGKRK
ncbi:MAG: CPBP family intramembrane metalloprotease [Clostridiales bacterium]|nr:CPBP family intramembrane metalloprotease [Clostridiales bacterium]